ncbi:hypothetical protein KSS87_009588 [Heliosperma pusillum]|nr:hypothetical protein KSS87_009588 [Heliosperma pusillum]
MLWILCDSINLYGNLTTKPFSFFLPKFCCDDSDDWVVVSPMICFDIVQWHLTNKVARQFGWKQDVPVIAFSDEEGVRFQSTFLGSAAISGILPASSLNISDKRGNTLQNVLKENSIEATEETLLQLKYQPQSVWGYVEVHIEQGPVLELAGLPLAVVKGIAGQTRLKVTVSGSQGHAGTVPMSMRRDPMAAAAELILLLESLCKHPQNYLSSDGECSNVESLSGSLVCTVGELSLWPSASNVIPGQAGSSPYAPTSYATPSTPFVTFTIDLRAMDDAGREAVLYELSKKMYNICDKRSVSCVIERKHDANAVNCDSELSSQLNSAALVAFQKMAGNVQVDVPKLMSGAGHDAMAMAHLTKSHTDGHNTTQPIESNSLSVQHQQKAQMEVENENRKGVQFQVLIW